MSKLRATYMSRLITCDKRLERLVLEAIKTWDTEICVICGHRNKVEQDKAFSAKASKLKWPHSKHNKVPSKAVDIIPMKAGGVIDWKDYDTINRFAAHVKETAKKLDIAIEWGGDWNFKDLVHFQLKE